MTATAKRTATQIIRDVLNERKGEYLAVHEITAIARSMGEYISDNATASRLCMELKGEVEGRIRDGKRFKEWAIPAKGGWIGRALWG